jgi:sugar (pentulose or hexulose) kinase
VVGAITGRTVVTRRHLEAASVGARLLAAAAAGEECSLDAWNPVATRTDPDLALRRTYRDLRAESDRQVVHLLDGAPAPSRTAARGASR